MTITDGLHYIAVGNPLSKAIIGTGSSILGKNSNTLVNAGKAPKMSKHLVEAMPALWSLAGRNRIFVQFAGLSGASAVILGAIGSHSQMVKESPEKRAIFDTANRFHFFHTLALLGVPLAKYPLMSGILMIMGTALFSGCLYYRSFTGNKPPFAQMAPMGGSCLILAWLSLLL